MKKQLERQMQARMQALYRYTCALEQGDADTLTSILAEAEQDQILERMLVEVNEVYQIEDHTVVHADDVVMAQEMLQQVFGEPTPAAAPTARGQVLTPLSAPRSLLPRTLPARPWYSLRRTWATAAAAALLLAVLVVPGTSALAAQLLSLFQPQQFQAVTTINPVQEYRDFSSYIQNFGDLQQNDIKGMKVVSAHALRATDLTQPQVEQLIQRHLTLPTQLPAGVGSQKQFSITPALQETYTFNVQEARAYLAQTGQSDVAIPTKLDGATFTLKSSSAVTTTYYASCQTNKSGGNKCSGGTPFVIIEDPSPIISATGSASLTDLRDFMLTLPKISPDMRNLLQQVNLGSGIVPIPVPATASAQQVTIQGAPGLLLSDSTLASVVWQAHGTVYILGAVGSQSTQLLATARSLR